MLFIVGSILSLISPVTLYAKSYCRFLVGSFIICGICLILTGQD